MAISIKTLASVYYDNGISAAEDALSGLTEAELMRLRGELSVLLECVGDAKPVTELDED